LFYVFVDMFTLLLPAKRDVRILLMWLVVTQYVFLCLGKLYMPSDVSIVQSFFAELWLIGRH